MDRLDELWRHQLDSGRIVGGVLLLAEEGEVRYASARGWADREGRQAAQRDTVFRLASLTKLLTSVVTLRLAELQCVELDGPVHTWLPDFRPRLADGRRPDISLHHLLSHTAGLGYGFEMATANHYAQAGISDGLDDVSFSLSENLRRLAEVPLLFEPGTRWRYSLATEVLGAVIEQASGLCLSQAVARWVTKPLGMRHTGFAYAAGLARPYKDAQGRPVPISDHDQLVLDTGCAQVSACRARRADAWPSAGAGLLGTADDYLRLLECLRLGGSPLLTPQSTALLTTDALKGLPMASRGQGWGFGLGPAVLTDRQAAGQRHASGTWGWCGLYGCHYWVDPQARMSLVALTNTAVAGAWGALADSIVDAIYR
ncbi:beta-lactamase family protein [Pseudomonas putida]|uniref:serine hydrolase domain-containing protein n=1 Tax=Pseudomonas TaxID=286 RepID=UPI000DB2F462|nr:MULTISPECIES: serine hydrolase domain-containing protein [Pseudomonas]MBI6943818.1 beta-lactamase family protein [Pseudomonas putida]MBI6959904.1 beta-lactamase family protein [Pseudomonas putida]MCZ9637697.1 beta-lactamase family protein [Pseudomonas putida]MEC4876696.1 beta-lactamase family protein [Pseudomonas sp. NC26]PZQ41206.1 MAG: esterase [Pseudomonas putida]